jgi:uncharacterized membrane protein YagU involved in acid resistance
MCQAVKNICTYFLSFSIQIREIYHMLNFLWPNLKLDTAQSLYFDLEYQRFALHIIWVPTNVTMKGEEDIK